LFIKLIVEVQNMGLKVGVFTGLLIKLLLFLIEVTIISYLIKYILRPLQHIGERIHTMSKT